MSFMLFWVDRAAAPQTSGRPECPFQLLFKVMKSFSWHFLKRNKLDLKMAAGPPPRAIPFVFGRQSVSGGKLLLAPPSHPVQVNVESSV